MSLDRNRARQLLAKGEFQSIFIEELGWDRHSSPLEITAAAAPVRLQALAQKRGMVVYHCPPPSGEKPAGVSCIAGKSNSRSLSPRMST